MNDKIKQFAKEIVENISNKIKESSLTSFHRFGSNTGLGADGTVTKYIDKLAEDVAVEMINTSDIKVNLLSEEIGFIDNNAKYTFVLDPVDGTRNAYRGIPFYAVSLAIGKKSIKDVEFGIVKNIPTGNIYSAEKKVGAFFNNKKLVVPDVPDKQLLSSLSLGKNSDPVTLDLAKKEKIRSLGSASLEMCMVAKGALDFYVVGREYIRVFDIAASTLILREAGGFVKNILGKELDMAFDLGERSSVVAACNMDLVERIVSL